MRDGSLHSLTIADAFPEDSGVYVCQAVNQYGSAETACTLTVISKENCTLYNLSINLH